MYLSTHPVPAEVGGKGTGLLKLFSEAKEEETACERVCRWIWQRLVSSGLKNYVAVALYNERKLKVPVLFLMIITILSFTVITPTKV